MHAMTHESLEAFAAEMNALLHKYKLRVVKVDGPIMQVKDTLYPTDYSGPGPHNAIKNALGNYWISEPWGG